MRCGTYPLGTLTRVSSQEVKQLQNKQTNKKQHQQQKEVWQKRTLKKHSKIWFAKNVVVVCKSFP